MKIRIESAENDEIIIRCREPNEKIYALKLAIEDIMRGEYEIALTSGGTEYFIPKNDILFFESFDGKVYAHTKDGMYTAPYKLFELETLMPVSFVRISKSAVANLNRVSSIRREVVGNGELAFRDSHKKVYFSRAYYKLLQYKMEEMRLKK
ncbi:MAG: LytTR family transcriptional regulator DNA-binding domain-containing protein [Clostridia bacterium]|nr:LytTR family transcriptional regulator DNA-binding domain-containing protein [Clostridia bacterium]